MAQALVHELYRTQRPEDESFGAVRGILNSMLIAVTVVWLPVLLLLSRCAP